MNVLFIVFLVAAIIAFLLEAFKVKASVAWTPLGFAFVVAAFLVASLGAGVFPVLALGAAVIFFLFDAFHVGASVAWTPLGFAAVTLFILLTRGGA